jgi:hypothetical protein
MDTTPAVDSAHPAPAGAGERLAGFIYGTLVVLAMVVVGAKAYPEGPGLVAALVVVTAAVLWLAHVYAHGVALSVSQRKRLSLGELRHLARREGSIVQAALPPVLPLLLAAAGLVSTGVALWAAVGLGLVVLGVQGVRFARIERLGAIGTCAAVAANLAFGVLIVGLKLLIAH